MKIKVQNDILDCGLYVIQAMYHYFFSKWLEINELKKYAKYSQRGISAFNLIDLAKKFNLDFEAYEASWEEVKKTQSKDFMICITKEKQGHHYVVFKIVKNKVLVYDSILGKYKTSLDDFALKFNDFLIFVKPIKWNLNVKQTNHNFLFNIFKNKLWHFFIIILINIMLLILTFISPLFMKIILDQIIPNKLAKTFIFLFFVFLFIEIIKIILNLLFILFKNKLKLYFEVILLEHFIDKYANSKLDQLNKLTDNDYLRRISLINSVASFESDFLINVFYNLIYFWIALIILFIYSSLICLLFLISNLLIFLIIFISKKYHLKFHKKFMNSNLDFLNSQINLINNKESLKNTNFKKYFLTKWDKNYFEFQNSKYQLNNFLIFKNILLELLILFLTMGIIYLSINFIFQNQLSAGILIFMIFMIQSGISSFKEMTYFFISQQENQENINLLNFVFSFDKENNQIDKIKLKTINSIEIKNLSFNYDKHLFKINYFKIDNNIHLFGKNGSGKSTFLKILSTKYVFEINVKVNNSPLFNYDLDSYRKNIVYLNGQISLSSLKIIEYITLNDPQSIKRIFNILEKYNLFNLLEENNINLDYLILNKGENFSSGQKQIINLLHILASDYKLVLLDEAAENIDENNLNILKKIFKRESKAIFIEISHNNKFISQGKKVDFETIIEN